MVQQSKLVVTLSKLLIPQTPTCQGCILLQRCRKLRVGRRNQKLKMLCRMQVAWIAPLNVMMCPGTVLTQHWPE
jgi:hypothetical protein